MEKSKTYTASDFARYHAGTMPAAEMHALEKSALEDPFLADALEGYAYTNDPGKHIAEIHDRLSGKKKNKKVFSILSVAQNKWWRVAALFIIITGVGYLLYRNDETNTQPSLANLETTKPSAKDLDSSIVLRDTISAENDIAFGNNRATEQSPIGKTSAPKMPAQENRLDAESLQKDVEPSTLSANKESNYSRDTINFHQAIKSSLDTSNNHSLPGRVVDEAGLPIPFATIAVNDRKETTTADQNGYFVLLTADSSTKVLASAMGFAPKGVLLSQQSSATISLARTDANLEEVVVTGYASKSKKASPPSKTLRGKVAGVAANTSSLKPFPVNDRFKKYLKEHLVPVYDDNNDRLSGEVQLSFKIDENGAPQNISVVTSTCKQCEAQAIQLLRNGPAWEGERNVPGTVDLKF
ncbi:MAG: carboxypeptidase-like regulatory domain-containing protein [Ginsengibacter sp.]